MPKLRISKLPRHAHTHAYGDADPLPPYSIDRSQINALGVLNVGTAIPLMGTGGRYAPPAPIYPQDLKKSLVPLAATLTWEGTFGSGETVTIRITAVYNDGTSASITRSATAAGSISLNPADLAELYAHGKYITRLEVASVSSAPTTSVTTRVTIYALEI